jgi:hypothetical protein
LFSIFIGERAVSRLKCFPHKVRADIGSGETSSVTNGNLNGFHGLENGNVKFAAEGAIKVITGAAILSRAAPPIHVCRFIEALARVPRLKKFN